MKTAKLLLLSLVTTVGSLSLLHGLENLIPHFLAMNSLRLNLIQQEC